jgi:periplasmic divalent cation tolerance protein
MLIVLTTVAGPADGEVLAEKIVGAGLAACVQILPRMTSIYKWKGRLERDEEHLLIIKTLPAKFDELEQFITENHSYEVPEIVALNAERVSGPYTDWMEGLLG